MGADIGISYSIIATNLEMHGLEGLLLAVGIGGLSVAIKPLYDRMAEKRLHHEKHQLQGNKWSFIIVSVLTVVAVICCVGMFAYLRTDILAQTTASTDPATFTDGISVPQSENPYNPWAAWYTQAGMIAAGLVFIFGGTICMSIAIPVLFRNRKTHSWNRKSTKLQLEIDIAEDAVKPIAIETDMNVVAMHAAEETLGKIRGKIAQLEDPRNLEARRDELQAELAKEKTAQNIASYHDAYERGRASSDAEGSPTTSGPRRRRTERPWVEVRRLLAEHRRRQSIVPLVEETA
jgi:hypothetical protein